MEFPTKVELVPVIFSEKGQVVSASDLHEALGVGKDFSTWIKDRIEKYGFTEGDDYRLNPLNLADQEPGRGGDRRSADYLLSLDTAKEIAMVENNAKGREIRRYLISVEKAWNDPLLTAQRTIQLGFDPKWLMRELEKASKIPNFEYNVEGRAGRMMRIAAGLETYKDKLEEENRQLKTRIRSLEDYASENIKRMAHAGISPREWD
jgi:phage anti-repressor protein